MSTFTISLPQVGPIAPWKGARSYDQELDNITSLLSDICETLNEEGSVRFVVGGFGQDRWPVDVRTDLAVVIEQVPAALKALGGGVTATLDFYEQGIERTLTLDHADAEVIMKCISMTSWQPEPSVIIMKNTELMDMLGAFLRDFVARARARCPDLVEHPWFRAWIPSARNGTMTERERRQYSLMRDKLAEFRSGKLSIGNLVDSISALLDNVEEASPQWREAFKTHWWTIEQVYAVGLDRGNLDTLPSESRCLLTEAIGCLQKLVEQALAESPDNDQTDE